jgi:hypothetical protein
MQLAWKQKARKSSLFLNSINLRKYASHHKAKVASLKEYVLSMSIVTTNMHAINGFTLTLKHPYILGLGHNLCFLTWYVQLTLV